MNFKYRLKEELDKLPRKEYPLVRAKLLSRLKINNSRLSQILNFKQDDRGEAKPSQLMVFAEELNLTVDYILRRTEEQYTEYSAKVTPSQIEKMKSFFDEASKRTSSN